MLNCPTGHKAPAEGGLDMRTTRPTPLLSLSRDYLAILAAVLLSQTGLAQEPAAGPDALEEITVERDSGPMEELTVVAPQSLESMRSELVRAEEDVLAVFNSLNDDDDYDIRCYRETPLGSNIPVRTCRARFVDNEQARAAQDFMGGLGYVDPIGQLRYHDGILRQKMATLMEESPDLYQALMSYYELKTSYDAESGERFEDNFTAR